MKTKKIIKHFKSYLFPSKQQLSAKKYFADGGDNYFRFSYDIHEDSIVLDCGGYQGQWASDLFSRYKCQVFVFEPVTLFYEQIRIRFLKNNQIKPYNFGLGASTRSEKIHISADGSSLFGSDQECESMEMVDVKEWINNLGFKRISLIKINIEGGEYELLERLIESNLIERIDHIQVQFHNVAKDSRLRMESIQNKLKKTHSLTYQYEFVWENWTRLKS